MASRDNDVKFGFSFDEFKRGFSAISKGFTGMKNMFISGAKSMTKAFRSTAKDQKSVASGVLDTSKSVSKGVFSALSKFAILATGIVAAFSFARNQINKFVPEIGQTFSIASDIFFRNFLFPLRKALLPLLQRLLDWVRKNRDSFVKWGAVMVNVFKVAVAGLKVVFGIVKQIFSAVFSTINDLFGNTGKTLTQTVNLILAKLATVFVFLETLIKPISDTFTVALKGILTGLKEFSAGFVEGFAPIFENSEHFMGLFSDLSGMFDSLFEGIEKNLPLIRKFGEVLGTIVGTAVETLIVNIRRLISLVTFLYDTMSGKSFDDSAKKLSETFKRIGLAGIESGIINVTSGAGIKANPKQNDAVIQNGVVTPIDPRDTVIATKTPNLSGGNQEINLNFGNVVVGPVTEGNARQAGFNAMQGMRDSIRNILNEDMILSGGQP